MKYELCPAPFEGCKMWRTFHKKMGRWMSLIQRPDGTKTTISYAKYVMSVHLGRIPDRDAETVDHKNDDKTDDRIGNLQLLPRVVNRLKSMKPAVMVDLVCAECATPFQKRKGQEAAAKGYKNDFCGRSCSGKFTGPMSSGNGRDKQFRGVAQW